MTSETPTLAQVILEAVEARLVDVNTAIPGKIVSYDHATQTASVQPCIRRKYTDGTIVDLPVINKVPVQFPRGGGFFVSLPLKKDDPVLLVFSQRALDVWKEKGGVVDPADPRKFHISDAYALAGAGAAPDAFTNTDPNKLVIAHKGGTAEIHMGDDGKVSIKAGELHLGDHSASEFVALKSKVEARLSAIESALNSLGSTYNGHTHIFIDPVSGPAPTNPTLSLSTPLNPSPDDIGSAKVKVAP